MRVEVAARTVDVDEAMAEYRDAMRRGLSHVDALAAANDCGGDADGARVGAMRRCNVAVEAIRYGLYSYGLIWQSRQSAALSWRLCLYTCPYTHLCTC